MADIEALKAKYKPKMEKNELDFKELPEVLELLVGVANASDDFKEEFENLVCTWQFKVLDIPEDQWMWMRCDKATFSFGKGKAAKPDLTFSMKAQMAADMLSGKIDSNSAFMAGDLKLDGPIKMGMKFQGVQSVFRDAMGL